MKIFGRSVDAGSLRQTHQPKIALVQFTPKTPPKWPKPESLDDKSATIFALHAIGLNEENPMKKTHNEKANCLSGEKRR
jgi:hypothetical protein